MEITLKRNHGFELIFEAQNVRITEDIESREYPKDESGKTMVNLHPKRDINTDALQQFVDILEDMIYYRKAEFDSSNLIERLFNKLPSDVAIKLIKEIAKHHEVDSHTTTP